MARDEKKEVWMDQVQEMFAMSILLGVVAAGDVKGELYMNTQEIAATARVQLWEDAAIGDEKAQVLALVTVMGYVKSGWWLALCGVLGYGNLKMRLPV